MGDTAINIELPPGVSFTEEEEPVPIISSELPDGVSFTEEKEPVPIISSELPDGVSFTEEKEPVTKLPPGVSFTEEKEPVTKLPPGVSFTEEKEPVTKLPPGISYSKDEKLAPEVKSLITQFTDLFTKTSGEKEPSYMLPHAEHMARALGVDEDPGELVGFDPSGMSRYEKLTGKPRWQVEKRTKPSPYERTMAELADDPEWNRVGKLIYDYEQKNKGVSSVLELPADSGETALVGSPHDIKMGKGMSHGEWLQERFSKGFFDLTSLGLTLYKANEFPEKIKDAWKTAINMEMRTDWDWDSFKRGAYHTVTDPSVLAPAFALKAFQVLLRTLGGRAASQLAKKAFLSRIGRGVKEGAIRLGSKYSPITSVQRQLMSPPYNIPRQVALQAAKGNDAALTKIAGQISREEVTKLLNSAGILSTKHRALIGPLVGATWSGAANMLTQSLRMQLQMASPKLKAEYEQQLALGQPVPEAMRKHMKAFIKSPEEIVMNRDVIDRIINEMMKSKEPVAQDLRTEAKRAATEFFAKEYERKPTQKEIDTIFRNSIMDEYMSDALKVA